MNIKKTLTAIPVAAVLGLTGLAAVAAPASAASDWDRLAECESGGNWSINTGNGYYGGLQFSESSWQAVGGTGNPAHASKAEQINRAEKLQSIQGWGAWPSCSAQLGLTGSAPSNPAPAPQPTQEAPQQQAPVQQAPVQETAPAPAQEAPAVPQTQSGVAPVQETAPVQQETAPAPAVDTTNVPASDGEETYVIKSGDTLHKIAEELGVEGGFNTLFAWNDSITDPNLIFVGQEIVVS